MQFFGIGVLMAIYCFVHYIQSPIEKFRARDARLTDMGYTASVLPVLILTHYIPTYGSYLTSIDPRTRHMWNWIWQPFPIYISVSQFVLKKVIMPNTSQKDRRENGNRDLPTIHYTIGSLCALSAAAWYASILTFVKQSLISQGGTHYTRRLLHGPLSSFQILRRDRRVTSTSACLYSLMKSSRLGRAFCGYSICMPT
jgi:hypothetical protein